MTWKRTLGGALGAAVVAVFAAACDEVAIGAPPGAAEATAAAEDAPNMPRYCERMCSRTTECGLRALSGLARSGIEAEQKIVAEANADAKRRERECAESCAAEPPEDVARFRDAERCLAERDCTELMTCLADAAKRS